MSKNADALPGGNVVLISGVKPQAQKGKIYILSNEKIFDAPAFIYEGQSKYFNETIIQEESNSYVTAVQSVQKVAISQSGSPNYGPTQHKVLTEGKSIQYFKEIFSSYNTITSYDISSEDSLPQFSFINLKVTPEMIKDTNAIITITGIYIPEGSTHAYIHQLDLPVVASHDPNRMLLKQTQLNYRRIAKKKTFDYKVQFQNDGEGDARKVRLEIALPKEMDNSDITVKSLYPNCPPCSETLTTGCWEIEQVRKDTFNFTFNGISLPGSKSSDQVPYDSTRGFVKFEVTSKRQIPNKILQGRTNIYFDQNAPVTTNYSTAQFKKGLSPIVIGGYNHLFNTVKKLAENESMQFNKSVFAGIGIAPLAPYKKLYWEVDLFANYYESKYTNAGIRKNGEMLLDSRVYSYNQYDSLQFAQRLRLGLDITPLKYNINSWVSIGVGVEIAADLLLKESSQNKYYLTYFGAVQEERVHSIDNALASVEKTKFDFRPYVDVNIGKVYLGPSIGIRYKQGINNESILSTYLRWVL